MTDKIHIIDLAEETQGDYFNCMEEWSDEMQDGVPRKACWYTATREKGLRVKLARNQAGIITGMIQYAPVEQAWIEGEDLYFVYCIWVHGHKKGRGDMRGRGIGSALLRAAEDDAGQLQTKGLVVWGLILPFFMRAGWFKKHGYRKVDRRGISALLWKPFSKEASPPRWMRTVKKPEPVPGKVVITAVTNGWCTGINGMLERARRISREFGDRVVYREVDTGRRGVAREWGLSDALFVDQKNIYKGPPLTYKKIKKIIARKVGRL